MDYLSPPSGLIDTGGFSLQVQQRWMDSIAKMKAGFTAKGVDSWRVIVERYNTYSLLDFLKENEWPQDLIQGFATYGLGLGGYGSIMGKSFLEILRLVRTLQPPRIRGPSGSQTRSLQPRALDACTPRTSSSPRPLPALPPLVPLA